MGCFSLDVGGQSAQQLPSLTPEQEQLVALLGEQATPAIQAVTGATIPGQEFAPGGPSPLQQQAFGLAGQLPQQLQFDPNRIAQQFQPVAEFARQGFQQETIPAIAGAAGFGGVARSSGFQDVLAREGRNLELGLASQLGQQQIGAFERAQDRTGQLPGVLAGIGGLQRGFGEEQRQFGLEQFRAGAPEADPRLGFLGPAFTSPFNTAVQQGFAQPGIGSQLLGAAGSILPTVIEQGGILATAKTIFGCIKEGTIIDCNNGGIPIEDVRAGDTVYDKEGSLVMVKWKMEFMDDPTEHKFIELTFSNNAQIVVSDMHRLDGIKAKDLRTGENGLVSKKVVPMSGRSYDLLTSGKDGSYRSNGIHIDSMVSELYEQIRKVA